jgi:hypothetical protein
MFAIRIDKAKDLYNWYGCYVKDNEIIEADVKRVKTSKVENSVILTLAKQEMLHNVIATMTKTTQTGLEWTIKPEMVVQMIVGSDIVLNIRDKKEEKAAAEMIQGMKGITLLKKVREGETEDLNWRSIVRKRIEVRRITMNRKIQMIIIETLFYRSKIPKHISRLMPWFQKYGCFHPISVDNGKVPMSDLFFVNLFKERIILKTTDDVSSIVTPRTTVGIIEAKTIGERATIEGKLKTLGVEVDKVMGSKLIFSNGISVSSYASTFDHESDIGKSFRELFPKMVMLCTRDSQSKPGGGWSTLEKVNPLTKITPSINSDIIFNKIDVEMTKLGKERQRVNIIMIGEKGSGKSQSSKLMAEALKTRYSVDVDVVSSDAYGRWLYYLSTKYNVASPDDLDEVTRSIELNGITLEQYDELDLARGPSWFELSAEVILSRKGIDSVNKYTRLSLSERNSLAQEIIALVNARLRTKALLSYSAFHTRLESILPSPACIYECHITEESTQVARSDIVFRLDPFTDARMNVISRSDMTEAALCSELLLYDAYKLLIGSVNPLVYMSDLLHKILFSVTEKR